MDLKQQVNVMNQKINNFFHFVSGKLANFKNLSLGEQVSFGVIGAGLLLILTSIIMFVVV